MGGSGFWRRFGRWFAGGERRGIDRSGPLHLLLCHDRFVSRFGVDRVLIQLAREFRSMGHRVTLLGFRFDDTARSCADHVVTLSPGTNYYEQDLVARRWLEQNWDREFSGIIRPDTVLTAGWPFLSSIAFFKSSGCRVFYSDHGVIPADKLPENGKRAIALLSDLKATFVPLADGIVAVSKFILESQSRPCAGPGQPLRVILNGADHVTADRSRQAPGSSVATASGAAPKVLVAGRFEPGTYKQSELAFDLERTVRAWAPDAWLGAFVEASELASCAPAGSRLVALGHPDDESMFECIRGSDVTVCLSDWEGYNLPLAEAQALGRPCLVFDVGAHPEVVADDWLLCSGVDEMADRIRQIHEGTAPSTILTGDAFDRFAAGRTWRSAAEAYVDLFRSQAIAQAKSSEAGPPTNGPLLLMDATNAARDPANSGCVRVARRLGAELQRLCQVIFVVWDRETAQYLFPTETEFGQLGAFSGPARPGDHPVSTASNPMSLEEWLAPEQQAPEWLLLPEIRHEEDLSPILRLAGEMQVKTAAVFHDAIPHLRPDLVADTVYREGHFDYMAGLAAVDLVLANSRFSQRCLEEFWQEQKLEGRVRTCLLPGGFSGERPAPGFRPSDRGGERRRFILCVSTLEPRKNHRRLIRAFLELHEQHTELDCELVLVGSPNYYSPDLSGYVEQVSTKHACIRWRRIVGDDELDELYRNCDFTVYPSLIEGFGLPIVESIWYGKPCVCHSAGVMAELAAEGGCLTADMEKMPEIRDTLHRLLTDANLRSSLEQQCLARPIRRWSDYAAEFVARLAQVHRAEIEVRRPGLKP